MRAQRCSLYITRPKSTVRFIQTLPYFLHSSARLLRVLHLYSKQICGSLFTLKAKMVPLLYTSMAFLDDYRYEMWKGASLEP